MGTRKFNFHKYGTVENKIKCVIKLNVMSDLFLYYGNRCCKHKNMTYLAYTDNTLVWLLNFISYSFLFFSSMLDENKPKYTCDICGKSYIRSWSYYGHMREHASGEKQHKCEVCSKVFNYASNLRQHMLIHTGILTSQILPVFITWT
jgi:hypothetical protein